MQNYKTFRKTTSMGRKIWNVEPGIQSQEWQERNAEGWEVGEGEGWGMAQWLGALLFLQRT